MNGKFIVIYGANNLGKSEQVRRLTENIQNFFGVNSAISVKYPIYEIPTGQRIDAVIRRKKYIPEKELQLEYVANRQTFEPTLKGYLENGVWVVAEDYVGTGIAWGVTNGLSLHEMEEINKGLLEPDIAILIDGEQRYSGSIERGHRYEDGGKWEKARQVHLELGEKYGWEKVNANQSMEKVAADIWEIVVSKL